MNIRMQRVCNGGLHVKKKTEHLKLPKLQVIHTQWATHCVLSTFGANFGLTELVTEFVTGHFVI